jgi:hypothetical protein
MTNKLQPLKADLQSPWTIKISRITYLYVIFTVFLLWLFVVEGLFNIIGLKLANGPMQKTYLVTLLIFLILNWMPVTYLPVLKFVRGQAAWVYSATLFVFSTKKVVEIELSTIKSLKLVFTPLNPHVMHIEFSISTADQPILVSLRSTNREPMEIVADLDALVQKAKTC